MEPATGAPSVNGRATGFCYGRPFVDKPSFEGLPPDSLAAARTEFLASDLAAADWERVELLFERNWFGPCSCLGGLWRLARPNERDAPDSPELEGPTLVNPSVPSGPAITAGPFLRAFLTSRSHGDLTQALNQSVLNGNGGMSPMYGTEPAFHSVGAHEASPPKAMPVPRRLAALGNDTGDGPLPAAIAIEPLAAEPAAPEPVPSQHLPFSRSTGFGPEDASAMALGTWADRQYRLLDPVPERMEFGPGSASGNSNPSSASNNRSPIISVHLGRGMGQDSGGVSGGSNGSGGCGSGDYSGGGGSSSNMASHAPAASPTLLDMIHKQQHRQLQTPGQEHGHGHGQDSSNGDAVDQMEHGRRRPGSESLLLDALQQGQLQLQGQEERNQQLVMANTADRQAAAEAVIQEAAWRWRFTRRWQAEQSRTEPEHASSAPPDQLEEALAYLNATNATTTVSMQIANTSGTGRGGSAFGAMSRDGSLALQSLVGTLGAAPSTLGGDWPLGACGSGSGSFTSGPKMLGRQASGEMLAASREVASLNRRAAVVLQQQMECEEQAEKRVQESLGQGSPWVGQYISIVHIDEWGSFRFIMVKLRDQTSRSGGMPGSERQRILIRGRNYGSEGQLIEDCNREIMALSQKHGVPTEAPTLMGGGVMEWRRDRDRHLHLHSGFVMDRALPLAAMGLMPSNAGIRPASAMDLLNLAAALARQSFPPTYKITVLT